MIVDNKPLVFALAGNPNSGKTTLFNNLTGANQHVGNYPGVTVEKKEGSFRFRGYSIKLVDLPGTYSLSAHSIEEVVARNFIIEKKPDVVINIVDASNIERNLYLTTQLVELGIPVVIALNMSDMARSHGIDIDEKLLSRLLGLPVISTVGHKRQGMDGLMQAAIDMLDSTRDYNPSKVDYGKELEKELEKISGLLSKSEAIGQSNHLRWLTIKLLENDSEVIKSLRQAGLSEEMFADVELLSDRLQTLFGDAPGTIISDRRYGFISGACSEAVKINELDRHDISDKIDLALIHPILGLPIFGVLMWLMFNLTFVVGEQPMQWIEYGVSQLSELLRFALPEGMLASLLIDGIIAGVGGVIVFLPNIMLLFLVIAILEDTGYMARAAFVMDRVMHRIGLHGKSFIPMLIGFGCTVPAYMGARILEDKSDRLVTMHISTFMSCGARLPVYILICGAFWPENAGNVVFSIYLLGILVAVGMAKFLRASRFRGLSAPFIMELPPYRFPTLRSLIIHMWERSWLYLRKAGTVILGISIIMWFLMSFPEKSVFDRDYDSLEKAANTRLESGQASEEEVSSLIASYQNSRAAESVEYSLAGRLGKIIEPVISPLGFDWRIGIAIISAFAAKEVVVSTMGTIYGVGEVDEESGSLREKLATDQKYSPLMAYSFMVFILLYAPCMAAMAVFLKETGSWKELAYQFGYTLSLSWGMAFIVFQGGCLLGLG